MLDMRKLWMGALLAAAWVTLAAATPLPAVGKFIYSDACESNGGDFAGYRVTLIRNARGMRVIMEFNDDGPDGRDTARDVKFDPASGRLSFSFHGVAGDIHLFRGLVSRDGLKGQLDGNGLALPALKAVQKTLPDCP